MFYAILLLVFLGTAGLLIGLFLFLNRRRLSAELGARDRLLGRLPMGSEMVTSILREDKVSDVAIIDRLLSGKGVTQWATTMLARAGSTHTASEFLLGIVVGAAVVGVLAWVFVGGLPVAVVGAVVGGAAPVMLVKARQTKRLNQFEEQLPDALDMLVNALRAGYSLQAAMEFVGNESAAPLGPEFARFYDEQRLGVEMRTALLRLQDRVPTYDMKMLVTALLIQRETGGNLAEVLGNISMLMRERVAFRGQVDTLTAEPKMSAKILSGLPVAVFVLVYTSSPEFIEPLLTTPTGNGLLAYAIASVVVGYFVLMRLAKIDI